MRALIALMQKRGASAPRYQQHPNNKSALLNNFRMLGVQTTRSFGFLRLAEALILALLLPGVLDALVP
ncbi:hypothetical protein EJ03DRAFT_89690 [Teratosphaeria nubilosa]|uniref:Uncharacterized protein n=1 Tax=Teratosphaeria nubilosa TaxID=161662 RepID=A0A6G1LBK8_9PEZI|nr:hypothetical protein EJ03DRAFT_89690 [Teratosphaeria nubilosa]